MICLGIEATAHTFGIGIVKEAKKDAMRVLFQDKLRLLVHNR